MKTKHLVALVAMMALLAFAVNALAATGSLTVTIKNKAGVQTGGTITATRTGEPTQTVSTTSGQKTLTLKTGTWKIFATNSAGAKTPSVSKTVVAGANAVVVQFP